MSKFTNYLNQWAAGTAAVAEAREQIEKAATGAYTHILNASRLWVDENGTGTESARGYREALTTQQDRVWSKNTAKYGRILKTSTNEDGETTCTLTQPAMNAISVTRGGVEHGIVADHDTFGALRTAVTAANTAAKDAKLDPALPGLREELATAIKDLKAAARAIDDSAVMAEIVEQARGVANAAEAAKSAQAAGDEAGDKTGQPMGEDDKAAVAELAAAKKAA